MSSSKQQNGYTLAIIGCGTMGIAILSGVLDSKKMMEARRAASVALSQSKSNGSTTPNTNGNGTNSQQQQQDLSASIASLLELEDGDDATTQNAFQLPTKFLACVNRQESARKLKKTFEENESVEVICKDNLRAIGEADVVMIACKPQMVADILQQDGIRKALRNKLVCSICAGLTIKSIQAHVDKETTVVRAMPNTPSKVSKNRDIVYRILVYSLLTINKTILIDSRRNDDPYTFACNDRRCI